MSPVEMSKGLPLGAAMMVLPSPRRILAGLALVIVVFVGVISFDAIDPAPADAQELIECGNLPIISEACRQLLDGAAWLGDEATDVGGAVVASAFDHFTRWVAAGAIGAIDLVWVGINETTTPSIDSGSAVFETSMITARALAFPLLVAAALYSLLKRDASIAIKSAFLYLPGSVLGMVAAGYVITALLAATDQLSAAYLDDGQTGVALWLDDVGGLIAAGVGITAPILLVIFSFVLIAGSILVWLIMVVRSAAILITYTFMPLAFAAIIFPATRSWIRRLIEIQLSFILSKPVIVAVLSLGSQTLTDVDNALVAMMQAAALFYLAAFSPFALMKLLPFVGDEAVAAMEQPSGAPTRAVATAAGVVGGQRLANFLGGSQQGGPSVSDSPPAGDAGGGATGGDSPGGGSITGGSGGGNDGPSGGGDTGGNNGGGGSNGGGSGNTGGNNGGGNDGGGGSPPAASPARPPSGPSGGSLSGGSAEPPIGGDGR